MVLIIQGHGIVVKDSFLRPEQRILRLYGPDSLFHGLEVISGGLKVFPVKNQIFGKRQKNLLSAGALFHIFDDGDIFIMSHAHDPADAFGSGIPCRVSENIPQVRLLKSGGFCQRFRHLFIVETHKLLFKQIHHFQNGAYAPAAEM